MGAPHQGTSRNRHAEGILATAREKGCDLIVMASHGRRGVARLLLRSQAQKVVTLSPMRVLIYR
jgi:nucleotide-binding universal stress UspA family protein